MLKIPRRSKCHIVPSALPWCPLPDGTHGLLSWWGWEVFLIIDWSRERYHLIISSTEHCRSNKMINRTKLSYINILHAKIKMIILIDRSNWNIVIIIAGQYFQHGHILIDMPNWKIAISLQANGRKDVTERWLPAAIVEPSNIISGEQLLSHCCCHIVIAASTPRLFFVRTCQIFVDFYF